MLLKEREIEIGGRTLFGEDNNVEGWQAIAYVIKNRVVSSEDWWGKDIISVCLHPYQFSCWLSISEGHSKNFIRMMSEPDILLPRTMLVEAFNAVLDPTLGATHYHARTINKPVSFSGLKLIGRFGGNVFYK